MYPYPAGGILYPYSCPSGTEAVSAGRIAILIWVADGRPLGTDGPRLDQKKSLNPFFVCVYPSKLADSVGERLRTSPDLPLIYTKGYGRLRAPTIEQN
jgi:hypothetical protein